MTSASPRLYRGRSGRPNACSVPRRTGFSPPVAYVTHRRSENRSWRRWRIACTVGDDVSSTSTATVRSFACSDNPRQYETKSSQDASAPSRRTVRLRSGSYTFSTDACSNELVPLCPTGCSPLPSTFVGRPSWLCTNTGRSTSRNGMPVAYRWGIPGICPSGARAYGRIFSSGRRQPARPAIAMAAPISCKN